MKLTQILALSIVILLGVVFYQHNKIKNFQPPAPKVDTVINYVEVHDTVPGKPKLVKVIQTDTVEYVETEYLMDPEYYSLLEKYTSLSTKYYAMNIFETKFPIKYGFARVIDTVTENKVLGNDLILDIEVPERIIKVTQPAPPTRQYYIGTVGTLTSQEFLNSVSIGGLYKDKKDRIFGASIGINESGKIQYGISSYIKIK